MYDTKSIRNIPFSFLNAISLSQNVKSRRENDINVSDCYCTYIMIIIYAFRPGSQTLRPHTWPNKHGNVIEQRTYVTDFILCYFIRIIFIIIKYIRVCEERAIRLTAAAASLFWQSGRIGRTVCQTVGRGRGRCHSRFFRPIGTYFVYFCS